MASLCRVTCVATPRSQSIEVEEVGETGVLLLIIEDDCGVVPICRRAWHDCICAQSIDAVNLRLGPNMPVKQKAESLRGLAWLLRRIQRGKRGVQKGKCCK